ncbi:MAG: putative Fe-S cluster assembly protein SufT [Vicinamibacteria bacterium]|nr:putative Fe-S cluster assembly protein SufT [Vicinamibacteria bacterium]MCL4821371.1 putative Fe-S cluster assembly protein SufT [Vicinamibacteria bacterium]
MMRQAKTLSRDIEATAIPYGDKIPLKAGAMVYITQALGGTWTAMTDHGYMVRIEATDADAIGETADQGPSPEDLASKPLDQLCWDQLKTCFDPEIPVNIVDLGLVYECVISERPEGGHKVNIRFTLTAPGCGMGDYLKADIERKIASIPGVDEFDVQLAFEPQWNQAMMSDAARLQLGLM